MNVQIENLPNCLTTLRIEVPADKVAASRDAIIREYTQYARLPGYRAGKAPRPVVVAKYKKEIHEELKKRLVSDSIREAIKENNLRALSVNNVEDVEFPEGENLVFTATVITAPAFELPEYKGIAIEVASPEASEEEVDKSIERLREQNADYGDITDRNAEAEDFAVITYSGTLDGQPIHEVVTAVGKQISSAEDFWVKLTEGAFLPGFVEKLVGAAVGETREFDLELPADFALADLAGKTLHYSVTLNSLKKQQLPELDDAFAATIIPDKTLAEVREIARTELSRQKSQEVEQEKRNRLLEEILSKVEFELPESYVRSETHRVLTQLIEENQERGVPDEVITANQKELLTSATTAARQRLRGSFVLTRVAEAEKIVVTQQEFDYQLSAIAARRGQKVEKLRKEFDKAGMLDRLHEDILNGKTLDFLVSNASVSFKAPEGAAAPATPAEEPVAVSEESKEA